MWASLFPSAWAKAGAPDRSGNWGTRRSKKASISRRTSGSAPSLTVRPQVVCGLNSSNAPSRRCCSSAQRATRERTSGVISRNSQRARVEKESASTAPPFAPEKYVKAASRSRRRSLRHACYRKRPGPGEEKRTGPSPRPAARSQIRSRSVCLAPYSPPRTRK